MSLYIGMTKDIVKRIREHNSGKTKSIKSKIPYSLIYKEEYEDKSEALKREKQIKKSGKIRNELKAGIYSGPFV